jgi:hypothetical protein
VQLPILLSAIVSLQICHQYENGDLTDIDASLIVDGLLQKAGANKRQVMAAEFYLQKIKAIGMLPFNINKLAKQIRNECIWDTDFKDDNKFGNHNEKVYGNCASLVLRITSFLNNPDFSAVFGIGAPIGINLGSEIDSHITSFKSGLIRINMKKVSYDPPLREVVVNAIGRKLLNLYRTGNYKISPTIVIIDEAHQFLNKSIKDEFFASVPLDAFETIAKESRKFGLFICLSTQVPRDIPRGALSQIGTFLVHRLINKDDKSAVSDAITVDAADIFNFVPVLGPGEAVLVGINYPIPIPLKIARTQYPPSSSTPSILLNPLL